MCTVLLIMILVFRRRKKKSNCQTDEVKKIKYKRESSRPLVRTNTSSIELKTSFIEDANYTTVNYEQTSQLPDILHGALASKSLGTNMKDRKLGEQDKEIYQTAENPAYGTAIHGNQNYDNPRNVNKTSPNDTGVYASTDNAMYGYSGSGNLYSTPKKLNSNDTGEYTNAGVTIENAYAYTSNESI